jgi:RNA polymerase sigma-70 factor (ECF subfamily)
MAQSTDRRARFEELFYRYRGEVRAYTRRRASPAVVEDAVAETFLIAWRRLDSIGDDPLPWLFGVARRVIANQHRGEHRRHALLARLRGDRGSASWLPASAELRDELAAALLALSPREREALLLVAWEGLAPERAATAAGCSPATFRARLHRARRHVRRQLNADSSASLPARSLEETP